MSINEGNYELEDYFTYQKRLFKALGLSVSDKNSTIFKIYSYSLILLQVVNILLVIPEIFLKGGDLDYRINAVIYASGTFTASSKLFALYYNRNRLGKALENIQTGIFVPNPKRAGPIEKTLVKNCIKEGNRQSITSASLLLIVIISGSVGTLLKRILSSNPQNWFPPFHSVRLFDINRSPNYEIIWLFQVLAYCTHGAGFLSADLMFITFCRHLCVQFKILEIFLCRITETSYYTEVERSEENGTEIKWKQLRRSLNEAISYHISIICLANELEDIFSSCLLWHHLGTFFMLCGALYHISVLETFDFRYFKDSGIVSFTTFEILMVSYWAHNMMVDSQKIGQACMRTDFAGKDVRFQKCLCLMMQRSQNAITFTLGKFTPLTMLTSVGALRAVVSYFMVLRTFKAREQED